MVNVTWVSLPDEIYLGNVRDYGTWEYYLGVST